jgi:hypothetical protein
MMLDQAIIELFDQGVYDPADIAQRLQRRKAWIGQALAEHAGHLIRQRTRELAGRTNVLLPAAQRHVPMVEEYGPMVWIPGRGYITLASCGSAELRLRAEFHRELAGKHLDKAEYFDGLADEVDRRGVASVAELDVNAGDLEVVA